MVYLSSFPVTADAAPERAVEPLPIGEMVREYCEEMNRSKPFVIRRGEAFQKHQHELRQKLLRCVGLSPLPDRVPLDVHESEPLDHAWCTVRRIHYQPWPGVYSSGLLYMPKTLPADPAPAVLCPHGHWPHGNANPTPRTRCLVLAKNGFVTSAVQYLTMDDTTRNFEPDNLKKFSTVLFNNTNNEVFLPGSQVK